MPRRLPRSRDVPYHTENATGTNWPSANETPLDEGQFVPVAFSVWDGTARERGNRRGITQWFYVYLPPREKPSAVGPMLKAAFGVLVLELLVVAALRRKGAAA